MTVTTTTTTVQSCIQNDWLKNDGSIFIAKLDQIFFLFVIPRIKIDSIFLFFLSIRWRYLSEKYLRKNVNIHIGKVQAFFPNDFVLLLLLKTYTRREKLMLSCHISTENNKWHATRGGGRTSHQLSTKKKEKSSSSCYFLSFFFGFPCDIDNKEKRKKFFFSTDGWMDGRDFFFPFFFPHWRMWMCAAAHRIIVLPRLTFQRSKHWLIPPFYTLPHQLTAETINLFNRAMPWRRWQSSGIWPKKKNK